MKKVLNLLPAISFLAAVTIGGVSLFALPAKTWSESERRLLASMPEFNRKNVFDGSYFEDLDTWMADHFAKREEFRHLRAVFQTGVLNENEYNGFVNKNGYIISLQKRINKASVDYAEERFELVYKKYLRSSACKMYKALIPDKSYFLENEGYPVLDHSELEEMYSEVFPYAEKISVNDALDLTDYYKTDSHWRQEELLPAAGKLLEAMGKDSSIINENLFEKKSVYPFLGVYAGQSAMDPDPEAIYYLTGGYIDDLKAFDLEEREYFPVYNPLGCDDRDLYTLFMGGGKGLIRIDNPNAPKGELVVFRDSFGAAVSPLLAASYSRVYLVDIRYVHPDIIGRYIRFTDQDVLFLLSETLINNSQGLR